MGELLILRDLFVDLHEFILFDIQFVTSVVAFAHVGMDACPDGSVSSGAVCQFFDAFSFRGSHFIVAINSSLFGAEKLPEI